jgi:hypothetical protein
MAGGLIPMQKVRRFVLLAPLLLALAVGAGCATNDTRLLARQLDPLIGKADKELFIEKYGEPVAKTRVDGRTDVWEFVLSDKSVGDRTGVGSTTISTRLRATFKDGILESWRAFNAVR